MRLPMQLRILRLPQQPPGRARAAARWLPRSRRCRGQRRWGRRRIGVFIGTSTAGILHTETRIPRTRSAHRRAAGRRSTTAPPIIRFPSRITCGAVAGLAGPAVAVCIGLRVERQGVRCRERMIAAGLIDAALVGGADSLCLTTLYGFHSLQLSSRAPCRPFDVARDGISIGEAAAFALLERARARPTGDSDPAARRRRVQRCLSYVRRRTRKGAGRTQRDASRTRRARRSPRRHRLHQSARHRHPEQRPRREPRGHALFGRDHPCSSTKGATGHALGAAGALEAVISALALQRGLMPGGLQTTQHRSDSYGALS